MKYDLFSTDFALKLQQILFKYNYYDTILEGAAYKKKNQKSKIKTINHRPIYAKTSPNVKMQYLGQTGGLCSLAASQLTAAIIKLASILFPIASFCDA